MEHYKSRTNDFFHFSNPHDYQIEDDEDDDDDRSCDFQFHPFRPLGISQSHPSSPQATHKELGTLVDGALISEIDRTMKKLSDNMLYAIEGISTRLSQVEGKTWQLDDAVKDLKHCAEYYHGKTDGNLRQLQEILQEVQDGVQFLREKHEIAETRLQLAKIQGSKRDQRSSNQTESVQQVPLSALQQSHDLPPAVAAQFPGQLLQNQIPSPKPTSHYPSACPIPEITVQQYHLPPTQPAQPPHQICEAASQLPHFSQSQQLPHMHSLHVAVTPQSHPLLSHRSEERHYMPSYSHPPNIPQSSSQPTGWGPTQEFDVSLTQQMHGQSSWSIDSQFHMDNSPESANFVEMHPYSKYPSSRDSSTIKPLQFSPIPSVAESESNYARLPKAQILPHALPTASILDDALGSGGNGTSLPVDDVVEQVTAMGFRRDLVKATVRKMTENGQSVDLNVVLDKVMNNG